MPIKTPSSDLLKQLDDAEKTGKNQTVRDLRDKLNEKRKTLGDEKFKEILEQIQGRMPRADLLALLKKLFPDLFPDEPCPASPAPHHRPVVAVVVVVVVVAVAQSETLRSQRVHEQQADYRGLHGISTTSLITATPGKSRTISGVVSARGLTVIASLFQR